jgi:amino acid adenylation domain-containing protein
VKDFAPTAHLAAYLEESARRFPHRTAVVDPDGSSVTYRELNDRAASVAGFLVSRGVAVGDRVGLVLPKSIRTVTAIFGVLKAGGAYVPADWSSPPERNRTIHSDCAPRAVFVDSRVASAAVFPDGRTTAETLIVVGEAGAGGLSGAISWSSVLEHPPLAESARPRRLSDLAYILYTSGSTGVPKGVMLTHENATSFVEWCSQTFRPTEQDRFSSHAPFHFDLSVLDIYLAIKHAASLHLISDELGKDPRALAKFIADSRLTMWYSTPSILAMLAEFGNLPRFDCSSLRVVNFAGEVFPPKHLRAITRLWPHAEYFNLYGPTETNVCTFARIPLPVPEDRVEPYPIGWPCSHCRDALLDSGGAPVPPGSEGMLHIAGPSVFQGYWNRPELNAQAFLMREGLRWYNTGDVVTLHPEHGYIYLGRRDRMVKRRGYRIELGEVESGLYKHDAIREAAAVAFPVADGVHIAAFLAPKSPELRPSLIDMKMFCARHIPVYMVPDLFFFKDALPRTSTDKVDYQALLREASAGAPKPPEEQK